MAWMNVALRRKLWGAHLEALQRAGYQFRPSILDDILIAQDRALQLSGNSSHAHQVAQDVLEAGRIDVPFRDVCLCGNKHP